jgi:UDP-N-acetylglucosamine--N-acetylmuramyl-(pentapeptide) pyrophosphoryl-undecaprenol N-acetylglucosamine transferase
MKITYGVSSVGLGHARRSLTLARYLRKVKSDLEITWFCAEPVISFLEREGEKIPPVSRLLTSLSSAMEERVSSGRLDDMSHVARVSSSVARRNYELLKKDLSEFDVLIQDEFVETLLSFMWDKHSVLPSRRIAITDYLEIESKGSWNPVGHLINWYANRMLSKAYASCHPRIFADDPLAVPLSLRKRLFRDFSVVGPILPDPPAESKSALRKKILSDHFEAGLDNKKLIVISVGGTSTGRYLIDFFTANSEFISRELDCRIIVMLGPRIDPSMFAGGQNSCFKYLPFIPDTVSYFKAADCVVCQAGASTLNEVTSVGTPCLAIPIFNHFEQEANAKRFAEKYSFSVLDHRHLTKESIASGINRALNREKYSPVDFSSNVAKAGQLILEAFKN